ncbi:hypothetical protein TGMAS_246763 [Toxoplasma gondii MAS]|uniref:Uncharacterized protein n=2 Tax=Toxoplasma gondii TaxID=5811 RepID=A0A086QU69_TOXGO|nr:hypothetical protein TGMAS_246763 [Toxoplasma gondii MAS]PUA90549.1 hypothetical protein TGBR9_246763 [Toxoplasma gondii TgCATBr9]
MPRQERRKSQKSCSTCRRRINTMRGSLSHTRPARSVWEIAFLDTEEEIEEKEGHLALRCPRRNGVLVSSSSSPDDDDNVDEIYVLRSGEKFVFLPPQTTSLISAEDEKDDSIELVPRVAHPRFSFLPFASAGA